MCGICGIARTSRSGAKIQRTTIERMRDVMTHRGPVPVGAWLRGRYRFVLYALVVGERALGRLLFDQTALRHLFATHVSGESNRSERLWSLNNLEICQRIHLGGEPLEVLRSSIARPSKSHSYALSA